MLRCSRSPRLFPWCWDASCLINSRAGNTSGISKPEPMSNEAQAKTFFSQALINMYNNKFKQAEEELQKALALEPQSAYINFKLAQVYAEQNKYEQAVKYGTQAIALDPQWTEPYHFLIQVYIFTHKAQEAEALAKKLLEMDPQDSSAVIELSRTYQAQGLQGPSVLVLEEFLES